MAKPTRDPAGFRPIESPVRDHTSEPGFRPFEVEVREPAVRRGPQSKPAAKPVKPEPADAAEKEA